MKKIFLTTISIAILILGSGTFWNVKAHIPAVERSALIDLYNSNNGDSWRDNSGWKTPPWDIIGDVRAERAVCAVGLLDY